MDQLSWQARLARALEIVRAGGRAVGALLKGEGIDNDWLMTVPGRFRQQHGDQAYNDAVLVSLRDDLEDLGLSYDSRKTYDRFLIQAQAQQVRLERQIAKLLVIRDLAVIAASGRGRFRLTEGVGLGPPDCDTLLARFATDTSSEAWQICSCSHYLVFHDDRGCLGGCKCGARNPLVAGGSSPRGPQAA
jgi:hypothetical protein